MAARKRIVLCGYYGFRNAGDELILKNIILGFKEYLPQIKVSVLTRRPKLESLPPTESPHPTAAGGRYAPSSNIKYISRYNPLMIIFEFLSSSALVMGGGSLIQDTSGFFTIYYYFILMALAKILRKKLIIFNQGIGPIRGKINRFLAKIFFLSTDLIIVRDENSREYIYRVTGKKKKVILGADVVFNNITPNRGGYSAGLAKQIAKVCFSLRKWKNYPIREEFLKTVKGLEEMGLKCYNISFHNRVGRVNLQGVPDLTWTNTDELNDIIAGHDVLVGMRLHSLIMAVINQLPAVGISYDPKVKSFCDFMDIPCLDISELSSMSTPGGRSTPGGSNLSSKIYEACRSKINYSVKLKILNERVKASWEELRNFLNRL